MKGRTHFIETFPEDFLNIANGKKRDKIIKNESNYGVDDVVVFMEYADDLICLTGRTIIVEIKYILSFEEKRRNMVIFSFALLMCCLNIEKSKPQKKVSLL